MKFIKFLTFIIMAALFPSCQNKEGNKEEGTLKDSIVAVPDTMKYQTDQFADVRVLRYKIPGFEQLTPKQKELLYYLYEAALAGKDIIWDQNFKYNLTVRKTMESIVSSYKGDKNSEDWKKFMVYAKRVWFSNGIHHHYSSIKFTPDCSKEYFADLIKNSDASALPINQGENT